MNIVTQFRTRNQMTQQRFADWVGVTIRTAQRWEQTGLVPQPVLNLMRAHVLRAG